MSFLDDEQQEKLKDWEKALREPIQKDWERGLCVPWIQPLYAPLEVFRRHGHMVLFTGINPGVREADAEQRRKAGYFEKYCSAFLEKGQSRQLHSYLACRDRDFWGGADSGWQPLQQHAQRLAGLFWENVTADHLAQIPAGNLHPFGTPNVAGHADDWQRWLEQGLELPRILQPKVWVIFGQDQGKMALELFPSDVELEHCWDLPQDWGTSPKIQVYKIRWDQAQANTTWVILVRHYNRMSAKVRVALEGKVANARERAQKPEGQNPLFGALAEVCQHFANPPKGD